MKRLVLLVMVIAALNAPASKAFGPNLPVCQLLPGTVATRCQFVAPIGGSIAYAIQGAIQVRVTHRGVTSQTCVFGSGAGNAWLPRLQKGDAVSIRRLTMTTFLTAAVVPFQPFRTVGHTYGYPCP